MIQKTDLGKNFYLWQGQKQSDEFVISSHGSQSLTQQHFIVPDNIEISFYVPDRHSLLSDINTLSELTSLKEGKRLTPYETFKPGSECRNYGLSKFQGYHGSSFGDLFGAVAKPFISDPNETGGLSADDWWETYEEVRRSYSSSMLLEGASRDIITVRYRVGRVGKSLKDLVELMANSNNKHQKLHCNFCRSSFSAGFRIGCSLSSRPNIWKKTIVHE
ncbi:putative adhesin [Pelagibaculum spongiae]|uniref:Putative adhesin Stv domain-containing protein n=1 Tax=Pelagibaculum spongiae TaxID=2080658 RepID=A0A2V1GQ14_9GAMM|nr:hypothetical protein [Pelagibaculum spongiae]PVZ65436.1 hypothetical protein DC094_18315 [Pelagibaculum spongiae]